MATFTAVAANVKQNLSAKVTTAEAESFTQQAFSQIWEAHDWAARKTEGLVAIVADYSTGTVDTTVGSATITGTSTVWTSAMTGRWIRIGSVPELFKFTYVSGTSGTIESPTGGTGWQATAEDDASYVIFQHVYALASDVEQVLFPTREFRLEETTRGFIDQIDPTRLTTGTSRYYAMRELSSTNAMQIEFWPRPNVAGIVRVPYLKKAPTLTGSDTVLLRQDVVTYLASHDAALYLLGKHGDEKYDRLAQRFMSLYAGDPTDKKIGALETAIYQDQARYGQVTHLPDATAGASFSDEFLSAHDLSEF